MRRGFGLIAMLCFCCFLGLCLLTSAFYYHQLTGVNSYHTVSKKTSKSSSYRMKNDYSGVGNVSVSNQEYHDLESKLIAAAKLYVKNNSITGNHKVIVSLKMLQNQKIIERIYDSNGYSCNGYVIYDLLQNHYTPYLRCGSYRNADYINRLE